MFQLFFSFSFSFFPLHAFQLGDRNYCSHSAVTVHALFRIVHALFGHFFIKNGSHGTIHIFKNYFAIIFSIFSKNKLYPNGPLMTKCHNRLGFLTFK